MVCPREGLPMTAAIAIVAVRRAIIAANDTI